MNMLEADLIPNPIDRIVSADQWQAPADITFISADDHLLEREVVREAAADPNGEVARKIAAGTARSSGRT